MNFPNKLCYGLGIFWFALASLYVYQSFGNLFDIFPAVIDYFVAFIWGIFIPHGISWLVNRKTPEPQTVGVFSHPQHAPLPTFPDRKDLKSQYDI